VTCESSSLVPGDFFGSCLLESFAVKPHLPGEAEFLNTAAAGVGQGERTADPPFWPVFSQVFLQSQFLPWKRLGGTGDELGLIMNL